MGYLAIAKRALEAIEEQKGKATVIVVPVGEGVASRTSEGVLREGAPSAEAYGAGRPSPENAGRLVEDRQKEALELLGELTYLYNERASAFEFAGLTRAEAQRLAMQEVQATKTFRAWMSLG